MRHKLVTVVLAITVPASFLLATQTMASAQKKAANGSSVTGTGSVACSDAAGSIKLSPGWKTQSNNLPAPSKAIFNVIFGVCTATGGNITTKVFNGHLRGSVAFPSNDCTTNFGAPVALVPGPSVRINWSKGARVGPVIPAATSLSLVSVTATFTAGVGIKFTFSHQTVTGSFAAKTMSGELDSTLDACSPTNGLRSIPITAGNLAQP